MFSRVVGCLNVARPGTLSLRTKLACTAVCGGLAFSLSNRPKTASCATESKSQLFSWGSNQYYQLGLNDTVSRTVPSPVDINANLIDIAAGEFNAAALTDLGSVLTWGRGQHSVLGHGDNSLCGTPRLVDINEKIASISMSGFQCAAVTEKGDLYIWGANAPGKVGPPSQPSKVPNLTDIKSVSCGRSHLLALNKDGRVFAWGKGYEGALGLGGTEDQNAPVVVQALLDHRIVQIAAGNGFSVLLSDDGTVFTCGIGDYGQTGHSSLSGRYLRVPQPIRSLAAKKVKSIAAGQFHAACCTADGEVFAWGMGADGQIGCNSTIMHNATPQHILSLDNQNVTKVSCGSGHTCACTKDGRVFAWGRGREGQLGQGGSDSPASVAAMRPSPIEIKSLKNVEKVALGGDFSLALVRR